MFTPVARWSSFWCLASARLVRVLRAVSRVVSSVVMFSPFPVFQVSRAMPVSSFPSLLRSLRTLLGALVAVIPGLLLLCPVRTWRLSLARPDALSPGPCSLLFFLVLFLGSFLRGLIVFFVFSPLGHPPLPLLLLLGVLRLLLILPLLPFVLIACRVLPLRGFFRVMLFSLLSMQLLLEYLFFFFCLHFVLT